MAGNPFSHNQLMFASRLIGDTGLDGGVVMAWMALEEPPGASANQSTHPPSQNWLNIGPGYTNGIWMDPNSAGDGTAKLLKTSSAYTGIMNSVRGTPTDQMRAIGQSPWCPGCPTYQLANFTNLYNQFKNDAPGGSSTPFSTPAAQSSTAGAFTVGDSANPFEDYWSVINRLSQEVNWYVFTRADSPNNVLFLADGTELLSQTPHATIHRRDPRILYVDFQWDNTAFQYKSQHRKKKRTQSRSAVATVTSPTEAVLHLICNIISFQPGDCIRLVGCGAGDGPWLVAEVRRSVFQSYSELILVPGILPVTQNAQHTKDITQNVNTIPGSSGGGSGGGGGIAGGGTGPSNIINMPLPARDTGGPRSASQIKILVLHSTEGSNTPGSTQDLRTLYNVLDQQGFSVHMGIDGDGNVARYVDDLTIAYHVAAFNPQALGIEQVGFASQSSWPNAQVHASAQMLAYWSKKFSIPLVFSTSHGVCRHSDLGAAGGGHTDPGPGYPFQHVLDLAKTL